ncbi:MAG TPA: hypothetical protein VNZ45_08150, partial [Bacteroidia bacterium]|nr:hypothetical protein [Bacteroidia bacterium]
MLRLKYLFLFFFISAYAIAQEHRDHITTLSCNPVLANKARQSQRKYHKITPPPNPPVIVTHLPFLDDFSRPGPYPDPTKWQNNNVFVNYDFPICPHTLGVATFDGVNSMGMPYDPSCPLGAYQPADTLTSQLIDLGNYILVGDSIYFSFYWQAGGLGSAPQTNDSLILEFFNGQTWNEVWFHLGYTPYAPDTGFHLVMLSLNKVEDSIKDIYNLPDSLYFISGFQFRFRNYANTSGNLDHWHIDEVYMNKFRSSLDTVQNNVSFVYESPSLLQNYEFMPWEQLASTNDLKLNFTAPNRNNDTVLINSTYQYSITPSGFWNDDALSSKNAYPFQFRLADSGYMKYPPFTYPPLSFTYS